MTDVRKRARSNGRPSKPASLDPYRTEPTKPRGVGFAPVIFIVILLGALGYFLYSQSAVVNEGMPAPVEQAN